MRDIALDVRACSIKDSVKSILKLKSKSIASQKNSKRSPNDSITSREFQRTMSDNNKELWDVARLPANVKPISKPSKRLEKYVREKETEHFKAIAKLRENQRKVNYDFEESYRYRAELLKIFLQKEKDNVTDVIKETLLEPRDAVVFGAIKYSNISSAISVYEKRCREAIDTFYTSVLLMEKQRCDNYKKCFRSSYGEMSEISHFLPFQIQQFFELEITKFNEILLQNYRCYAEVDTILKTEIEQNQTIWHQKFQRNKSKWIEFIKSPGYNACYLQGISDSNITTMASFASTIIQDKYKEVMATITELDDAVNEALRKCKFALLKIYYGEFNELHNLDDSFLIPTDAASQDQMLQFKAELREVMRTVENECILENEENDRNFQGTIIDLKERIRLTDVFFSRVSHLWDAHFHRESELMETVTNHIQIVMDNHDTVIQGVEMQLSIYNDKCRSAATVEEIQINFGNSVAALRKCADMYSDQMIQEQAILTKYLDLIEIEADILVAEIQRFLIIYEPNYDFQLPQRTKQSTDDVFTNENSMGYSQDSSALMYGNSQDDDNVPPHIKYVDIRILSLDNWKFGIWETIEAKMRECKDGLLEKAKGWTEPYKIAIDLRCQQKLALNRIKFYRLWLTVYYMRFIEIKNHNDRLDKHTRGINKAFEELLQCQKNDLQEVFELVELTAIGISNLEEDVKNAQAKGCLHSAKVKLKALKENLQKKIENVSNKYSEEKLKCEDIVQYSNIQYLKNVRMFSESGNFNADEVKLLTEELQKAEKDFWKKSERSQKEFLTQIPNISQKINGLENSLENLSIHMQNEFCFVDNIRDCMNSLQNQIKGIAYNLKCKRKVVEAYIERVKDFGLSLNGKTTKEKLEFFTVECYKLMKHFEELYFLLTRNDEQDVMRDKQMKSFASDRRKTERTIKHKAREPKSTSSTYRRNIASATNATTNKSAIDQNNSRIPTQTIKEPFNDSIVQLLSKKLSQMKNFGLSFYTTVNIKSIINKDKIENNFEEFFGNIVARCGYFQIQCDAMWLEEAIEYVKLVAIFRNGLVKTYKNFLTVCQEYNETKYENRFGYLQEILDDVELGAAVEIRKVHKRLKTLHGCPKNKQLLEKLYEEFSTQLINYDARINKNIGNFKKDHIDLKEFIIQKLITFDGILRDLLSSQQLRNLNGNMFTQILNLFTKLQTLTMKKINEVTSKDHDRDTLISKIATDRFSVYKSSLAIIPIPDIYITRFSVSNTSLSMESESDTFEFDDKKLEFADLAAYSKKMDYILDNHLEGVDLYTTRVCNDSEKWNEIWENDVKIIRNLYTVKYGAPPIVIDKLDSK